MNETQLESNSALPDRFPELGSDLVSALTSLDVDNFSHYGIKSLEDEKRKKDQVK